MKLSKLIEFPLGLRPPEALELIALKGSYALTRVEPVEPMLRQQGPFAFHEIDWWSDQRWSPNLSTRNVGVGSIDIKGIGASGEGFLIMAAKAGARSIMQPFALWNVQTDALSTNSRYTKGVFKGSSNGCLKLLIECASPSQPSTEQAAEWMREVGKFLAESGALHELWSTCSNPVSGDQSRL